MGCGRGRDSRITSTRVVTVVAILTQRFTSELTATLPASPQLLVLSLNLREPSERKVQKPLDEFPDVKKVSYALFYFSLPFDLLS